MADVGADLLFHPVRLRLIVALARGARLTAQQLGETLADVPAPTLYRHLRKLQAGGVLEVVEERRVRGAVERVYALRERGPSVNVDLAGASREDHMRYFTTFVAALLGDFGRYLRRERVDLVADGVGYREAVFYLSDEEFAQMVGDVNRTLLPYGANQPAPGRVRRVLATVVMPLSPQDEDQGETAAHEEGETR